MLTVFFNHMKLIDLLLTRGLYLSKRNIIYKFSICSQVAFMLFVRWAIILMT